MKTNIKKPTFTATSLGTAQAARKEADRIYKEIRDKYADQVLEMLEGMEVGETMLNKDIARAAGITPSLAAQIMYKRIRRSRKLSLRSVHTTTRYAEIDEDGKLVEGGSVCTKHKENLGYLRIAPNPYYKG